MLRILYIAIGGAVGAVMRYWLSGITQRVFNAGFPWGTLSVNLVGSLIIGFLWGVFEAVLVSQNMKIMIFIGLLGSFTTFATFSLESFHLIRDGEYNLFLMNVIANFLLGIALVFAGYFISQYLFAFVRR
jgi:CrcB protein